MKRSHGACIVALALGVAATSHAAMPITGCDATVPDHQKGVLQNDVVCGWRCSGDRSIVCDYEYDELCNGNGTCANEGITLERGSVLDLNGHDLVAAYDTIPVFCDDGPGRCVVKGPGHISGGSRGIFSWGKDIVVKNIAISAEFAAVQTGGRVTMSNADLIGAFDYGVEGRSGVKLKNVRVGSAEISSRGDIALRDVEIGPSSGQITSNGTIRGRDIVLNGTAGVFARRVVLRRTTSSADSNGTTDSWVSGTRRLSLVDSDVVTIASGEAPRLVRSTCQQSFGGGSETDTWGVCSGD